jgi:hypothetical protein
MRNKIWIVSIAGIAILSIVLFLVFSHRNAGGELIRMAHNGASEAELQAAAEKAPSMRLSADDVIQLNKGGVPDRVIITLLQKSPSPNKVSGNAVAKP